ncbi:hypothetical protein [Pedobacter gandavensis]|uniref:hypothetical protein n=1 Tax=Pedobacter gandavensis TaxID=2679963 RepID=UPI00292F7329|nr:hypothetical protein [Pedobacter gandavensis]
MQLKTGQSERQLMLMQSFFENYSSEEVLEVLYQLYRSWAYQVSIKTNREERLQVLNCYSDLKDLFEELARLQKEPEKTG